MPRAAARRTTRPESVPALRAMRAPLTGMIVGAVCGLLYSPLTTLAFMLFPGPSGMTAAMLSGVVGGAASGLTLYMGLALFMPLMADSGNGRAGRTGRARSAGGGLAPALVLTALYVVCMVVRTLGRGASRHWLYAAMTILFGVGLCVMTTLLLTASARAKTAPANTGHGVRGRVLTVFAASIVSLLVYTFQGVTYGTGRVSAAWVVSSNLYSAVNAVMLLLAVFLPLTALGGRLRSITGSGWHVMPVVGLAVGALLQVGSAGMSITGQWATYRMQRQEIGPEEYASRLASANSISSILGALFYLVVLVTAIVMLAGVSKAVRASSSSAVPQTPAAPPMPAVPMGGAMPYPNQGPTMRGPAPYMPAPPARR
ncbi:hypothetical protein [Bifidobacterium pluvialisilvae]|uniref:hypothetical protein n=1 Tax=Bifidobacterium pluvialisilvae TaxID=2834436 RepID=UPI001C56C19C|nr:hypothetical protein [Bifidobacterium pluvialisilvae]